MARRLRVLEEQRQFESFEQSRQTDQPASPETHGSWSTERHSTIDSALPTQKPDTIDGMGAVALRDGVDDGEYIGKALSGLKSPVLYYTISPLTHVLHIPEGPSSNVAFLRFIVDAVGRHPQARPRNHTAPPVDDTFLLRPRPHEAPVGGSPERVRGVEPYTLPPPAETERLLRLYFSTINLMIPCIHEESLRAMWAKARSQGCRAVPRPWLGVICIMLALATNVLTPTSPSAERAIQADLYFQRAMELAKPDILGHPSVELVQLFCLMVIYLEGTRYSSLAWTFHGLAVKGGYQLGLHFAGSKNHSPLAREVRRRLWYWCVVNDR